VLEVIQKTVSHDEQQINVLGVEIFQNILLMLNSHKEVPRIKDTLTKLMELDQNLI